MGYLGFKKKVMHVYLFQRYRWLKFVNKITLLKATLNGKSRISTNIFVNTKCINMKHLNSCKCFINGKKTIFMTA